MRTPVILEVNQDADDLAWERAPFTRLQTPVILRCGPETQGNDPLLSGESCTKIEKADAVIFRLNLDKGVNRQILGEYLRRLDVPIRVVATQEQQARWQGLLTLVEVFTPPIGHTQLDALLAEVAPEMDE